MKIHAIQTGSVAIKERQRRGAGHGAMRLVNTLFDQRWTSMLPIMAWVIEHPEGLIVVDAGETARTAEPGYFPRWHPFFQLCNRMNVQPEDEIGPSMKRLGLSPDDVRWVVLTHMHTDHAGGLHHFPKVEIVVSRREWAATRGFGGLVNGYLNHRFPTWLNPHLVDFEAKPFDVFPESMALTKAGDVQLVSTAGHSVGHLSVIALEGDVSYFLAGDTSYTERYLLEQAVDGISPDENAAKQTLSRILSYVMQHTTIYLPTHDPHAVGRLQGKSSVAIHESVKRWNG